MKRLVVEVANSWLTERKVTQREELRRGVERPEGRKHIFPAKSHLADTDQVLSLVDHVFWFVDLCWARFSEELKSKRTELFDCKC